MEVYTPTPTLPPHAPRARMLGRGVAVVGLLVAAFGVARFTFGNPSRGAHRDFGVVRTQLGVAEVACGGEASDCAESTALVFPSCRPGSAFDLYFRKNAAGADALARRLTGGPPPSGSRWDVTCRDGLPPASKEYRAPA